MADIQVEEIIPLLSGLLVKLSTYTGLLYLDFGDK